jgi:4-hydroxy-tetrahydrodipicolinate synthase
MRRLVDFQIENGVHGLWAMGTSAEFACFDEEERAAVVETVMETARGRVPVVANVSDCSTRLSIRHARRAASAGVDAIAATPPYYYPHSQDELLTHYRTIRQAVDLPLLIYNIPQTVRVRVELSTARTLAEEGVVAGIKDSQNDLEWFRQLVLFTRQRNIPFLPFVGTRYLIDAGILAGACGAIPSLANAFPSLCVAAYQAAAAGNYDEASCHENRIIEIESIAGLVTTGSRNAAVLGFLKTVLHRRGIIARSALAEPLRTLTADEQQRAWDLVERHEPAASARAAYVASPD